MKIKSKIMIVDDNELNRQILMTILGDEYEYVQAENGREAIHILQQDLTIDLMLLDINMPEMNGFQVLERMNTFHWINEIPVIIISSEEKNLSLSGHIFLEQKTIFADRLMRLPHGSVYRIRSTYMQTRNG